MTSALHEPPDIGQVPEPAGPGTSNRKVAGIMKLANLETGDAVLVPAQKFRGQAHSEHFLPHGPLAYPPLLAHWATAMGLLAHGALLSELLVTPKPGLVDRRNCGAHRDMNMETFLASARAIAPWWPRFVEIGCEYAHIPAGDFLQLLRPEGVLCENAMLRATGGINTHKGAIFSLGLLCAAVGRLLGEGIELNRERICAEVAEICGGLVERELNGTDATQTAGERCFRSYRLAGARGEAASGFALVRSIALPAYDRLRREGIGQNVTLLQVLLHLLAVNRDTNLVSRGGLAGLNYVCACAAKLLLEGGVLALGGLEKMEAFDDALIARHLSPGGSADLLAVTWFLAQFPTNGRRSVKQLSARPNQERKVRKNMPKESEPRNGNLKSKRLTTRN